MTLNSVDRRAAERARIAIAAVFLINGAVIGGWAAVIPSIERRLDLGHGAFGLALLAMAVGAILAMPIAGALVPRLGSRVVVIVTGVVDVAGVLIPTMAPNLTVLVLGLLLFGAGNGAMDVAMNAHGVAVERRLERPIMSSLHGLFSVGGLLGAGSAIFLLPYAGYYGFMLVLVGVLDVGFAVAVRFLLHGSVDTESGDPVLAWPSGPVIGIGALAFLALMSEGAIIDWSAIYLETGQHATASVAAAGFALFAGAMAIARLTGDRLRQRFGAVALVRISALMAVVGLGCLLAAPGVGWSLVGLALTGAGIGNVVPVLFGAASRLPGQSPGISIAAVTTMGYCGFLVGPPIIGAVAEWVRLDVALLLLVAAMAAVGFAARALRAG